MKEKFIEEFQEDMEMINILWITFVTSWKMAGVWKKQILEKKRRLSDPLGDWRAYKSIEPLDSSIYCPWAFYF